MAKIKERINGIYSFVIIPEDEKEIEIVRKMERRGIGNSGFNSDYATGQNKGEYVSFTPRKTIKCEKCGKSDTRYYKRSDENNTEEEDWCQ